MHIKMKAIIPEIHYSFIIILLLSIHSKLANDTYIAAMLANFGLKTKNIHYITIQSNNSTCKSEVH